MKIKQRILAANAGFTLIEMLIVVAIIGMIMGFVGIRVMKGFDEAKVNTTKTQMRLLGTLLDDYRRVCGLYPTTDQGLEALVSKPTMGRECKNYSPDGFVNKLPKDAWDRPFLFESDGNKYRVRSLGADGVEAGDGPSKDLSSDDVD